MAVQVPAIQGRPASVRPLHPVGHHHVGVQQRIPFSGRPVVEADRQQPLTGHARGRHGRDGPPGVRPGTRSLRRRQRGGRPARPGRWPRPPGRTGSRRSCRAQDHVECRHRVAAVGAAEELAGVGVAALEHGLESRRRCFARQPEAGGAGAIPAARGLAVAGQVLLVVSGQLAKVVILPTHRQLGDVGHHPAAPLPAVVGASNAPRGALLSSENGLRRE
jgi:hypothetical protein